MKIKNAFLLSLAMILIGMAGYSEAASATNGAGGQVNSKGQITFYEGTMESSATESSTMESSTIESTTVETSTTEATQISNSSYPSTTKPQGGGTYPSTGEVVRKYSFVGFGIILLAAWLLFNRRKKEEKQV